MSDLFESAAEEVMRRQAPLAARLRPRQLDDLVGHDEDTLVPALGCHDREADTGVARCRFDDRAAGFEQALALDPRSAPARTNLGLAHQRAGRLDLAVAAYHRALVTGGASAELYNNLGLAYQDLGRLDEAEAALTKAVAMSAGEAEAAINLKVLQLRRTGLESVALFEEMTGAFPQRAALWRSLASGYAARGRLDAAIAACRRVITLDPTDQQARANLDALLQKQRGQEVISD